MDNTGVDENFAGDIRSSESLAGEPDFLPPWLFRHEDLVSALESAQASDQRT